MDAQKADFGPLPTFARDGAEAQPAFEVGGALSREDYLRYIAKHYWPGSKGNLWLLGIAGAMMYAWGLLDSSLLNYRSRIMLCGVGFGLLGFVLLQGRGMKRMVEHFGKEPLPFCLRFFEDGFEEYGLHSMARRPWSDIARLVFTGDDLYLHVARGGVEIIPLRAFSGKAEELIGFLEHVTGKSAVRAGRKSKR